MTQGPPSVRRRAQSADERAYRLTRNGCDQGNRVGRFEEGGVVLPQEPSAELHEEAVLERLGVQGGAEVEIVAVESPDLMAVFGGDHHGRKPVRAAP